MSIKLSYNEMKYLFKCNDQKDCWNIVGLQYVYLLQL